MTSPVFIKVDKNGKKYAQHHIQGQKDQHLGQGEDKSHRYNQQCEKNEMVLGRAYQPPQRRPMDHACYHLETIKNIMTRKDDKGDQPSGGATTWTNTGATRSGRGLVVLDQLDDNESRRD